MAKVKRSRRAVSCKNFFLAHEERILPFLPFSSNLSIVNAIGHYRLIKSLGKGGMGEVFLAEETVCGRLVALKRIREDLVKFKTIHTRFLQEARIAAQLTHPAIIPIFLIHPHDPFPYYTMPYVEGKTLKQILREETSSISSLVRIFLTVCQAIAYTHARGILHRDLKPENIIVGKFGEVLLLDWGLAEKKGDPTPETEELPENPPHLTRPGKVVGTLSYLAPERALGQPASEMSDLYALGVILYQMLTLKIPFKRPDLATFQKMYKFEELVDPTQAAPYRDIPVLLSDIAKKCLNPSPEKRYPSVGELIVDIEKFINGTPEWILADELEIENKSDWEFQENVLLAKHVAITGAADVMEWVSLMISRASFSGNTRLEAKVCLEDKSSGIGFLLNVPEQSERRELTDGYCLWIGSQDHPGCKLFRSNIAVMEISDLFLTARKWHTVCIEKSDNHLRFFLDGTLQCHYISHTPLAGTHVGLLYRDADFELKELSVFIGSQSLQVSCLAIPDAFLASKNYDKALFEYRRIAYAFPGRTEGREAIFRAGVTLLEEGQSGRKKSGCLGLALEEFGKLRGTAGAPLEYLGKSLVYKALGETEEEAKCVELAIRKYAKHPLLLRLVEHVVFRLHESSHSNRLAAYHFALLSLRLLPQIFDNPDNAKLLSSLRKSWETPPFFSPHLETATALAFFLAKPIPLIEAVESGKDVRNALFALLELGLAKTVSESPRLAEFPEIAQALEKGTPSSPETARYLEEIAIDQNKMAPFTHPDLLLWGLLAHGNTMEAGKIFETYPMETLASENSPFFPLYGCFLWKTEGEAIGRAHFSGVMETLYPRSTALLAHCLTGKLLIKEWLKKAFAWEKMQLWRYLILFHRLMEDEIEVELYEKKLAKEQRRVG